MRVPCFLMLACWSAFAAHAQQAPPTGDERETILAGIHKTYPSIPDDLAGFMADSRRQLTEQSRCELLDWLAEGPDGAPAAAVAAAQVQRNVCMLPMDGMTGAAAQSTLKDKPLAIAVNGDDLTIYAKTNDASAMVCCSPQLALKKLGDGPYWGARVRLKDLDRGMLSFFPPVTGMIKPEDLVTWRGPNAPPEPPGSAMTKSIAGKLAEHEINSEMLGETRKVEVYTPPGWTKGTAYPAIFVADNALGSFMHLAEAMVAAGEMRPVVMVGVSSGADGIVGMSQTELDDGQAASERRAQEYLPNWRGAQGRFDKHMAFMADEVVSWAIEQYNVSPRREDHVVTGYSNGGVFALFAGVQRPDVFGWAVPMSPGVFTPTVDQLKPGARAKFRVSGGLYEPPFFRGAKAAEAALREAGYDVVGRYPAAGHFQDQWAAMMREALLDIFAVN